jgi:thiol-disulfide isomerase/thioredoxin
VRTDVSLLAGAAGVLALLSLLVTRGGARVSPWHAAAAAPWLMVPLLVVKCVGGALQAAGIDLWFLPHEAVDSMAVVVGREVSWLRFAVKCTVAYGPSLALAVVLVWRWHRDATPRTTETDAAMDAEGARHPVGLAIVAAALLSLAVASLVSTVMAAERIRPVQPGDALPEAALRRLDADGVSKRPKLKLSSLRGHVLLLDFWASWCAPCRRSMPELSSMHEELAARGLVVLGVNREPADPAAAAAALRQLRPAFESVLDERFYGDRIGLLTLPTSYLVDKQGMVRHLHLGYTEPAVVRQEIEALLSE